MLENNSIFNRIAIYGSSGSGKSFLAEKIGSILNQKVVHIDDIFWQPNWQVPEFNQFKQEVLLEINCNNWILDGNYSKIRRSILPKVTLAIILDIPSLICLQRIFVRTISRAYKIKLENITPLPKNVTRAKSDNNLQDILVLWSQAIKFKKKTYHEIINDLSMYSKVKIVILRSKREVNTFIRFLENL